MLEVLRILLYVVFGLSSLVLIVIILLQEGKGGGLAAAFGGAGADTFGVSSGGINRFTTILAGIWIVAAIVLAASAPTSVVGVEPGDAGTEQQAPENPGGTDAGKSAGTPEKGATDNGGTPAEEDGGK